MRLIVENYNVHAADSVETYYSNMIYDVTTLFDTNTARNFSVYPADECYGFPSHNASDIVLPGRYRSLYQDDLTDNRIMRSYNVIYRDPWSLTSQYPNSVRELRHTFRALMENRISYSGTSRPYTRIRDDAMGIDDFFMMGEFAGFDEVHPHIKGDVYDKPDLIGFVLKYNCSPRRYTVNGSNTAILFNSSKTINCNDIPVLSATSKIQYASPLLILKCGSGSSTSRVDMGGLSVTLKANSDKVCTVDFDTGKITGTDAIEGISGTMNTTFFGQININVVGTPGQCAILPRWYFV